MTLRPLSDEFDEHEPWDRWNPEQDLRPPDDVVADNPDDPTKTRKRAKGGIEPTWAPFVYVIGFITLTMAVLYSFFSGSANLYGALVVVPVLLLATMPIARRLAAADNDQSVFHLVMAACVAKLIGGLIRFEALGVFYGGTSDATQYDRAARWLAPQFRAGNFDATYGGGTTGTGFIKRLTGFVYAIFGASDVAGFLVFSWFAFVGFVLMWRAFKRGVPEGDHRRYAMLVLFFPSLLYWPSAIGKEAWMMLGIGLCAYGAACIIEFARVRGVITFGLGVLAIVQARPHIAVICMAGLLASFIARRPGKRTPGMVIGSIVVIAFIGGIGAFVLSSTTEFLNVENLTTESVNGTFDTAENRTAQGGSEFDPVRVRTPLDYPYAIVTMFVRPFPFEAVNLQALVASIEGVLVAIFALLSWRSFRRIPKLMFRSPYVSYCIGYVLTFVWAFSSFSNFGILARQRSQVLPFFLALMALSPAIEREARKRARKESTAEIDDDELLLPKLKR